MPTHQTMEALKSDLALNIKKIRKAQGVAQERLALGAQGRWRALDDSWHPPKPVDTFYKAVSMVSHPLTI